MCEKPGVTDDYLRSKKMAHYMKQYAATPDDLTRIVEVSQRPLMPGGGPVLQDIGRRGP